MSARDELPPHALTMLEQVMQHGDSKYPPDNYLRLHISHHFLAACRHIERWKDHEHIDADSGQHPLAHAALRLMMALEVELLHSDSEYHKDGTLINTDSAIAKLPRNELEKSYETVDGSWSNIGALWFKRHAPNPESAPNFEDTPES